ncbi:MAG: hypothetical protein IJ756_04730 [Paludibacteraceae bacterium]|nr:hypothetical protein [Paludibacteraceae bacterium]
MKKILLMVLLFVSVTANAQKDVTKFMGIPVDGYKADMKRKLIGKGFTYNSKKDFFEGEFNGRDVNVYVVTNKNKVWRIMVCDANTCDEAEIKRRFNKLCSQFSKNQKYQAANFGESDYTISESEDISYEMLVHKKRYDAAYFQLSEKESIDTLYIQERIMGVLLQKYTQEQIDNPTEEEANEMISLARKEGLNIAFDLLEKKLVWFMIDSINGRYYITMFYDNEYNHSDGEDL